MEAIAEIQEVVEEPPVMDTVLMWVGFEQEATRNRIREEGFESFGDLATMKEKDIRDLAESYGRRTVADGRYIFGLRRTRYLIGLIHWVQDFARVGQFEGTERMLQCSTARLRTVLLLVLHMTGIM